MTDARHPERWLSDRRLLRLSDADFRSFAMALLFSVSNRTDGRIDPEDLALIPNFAAGSPAGLVKAGVWTGLDTGWQITDFDVTQTSKSDLEVLENVRSAEARKKRRQRAAKAAENGHVPGGVPGDAYPGTAQDRTGKARTGKDRQPLEGYEKIGVKPFVPSSESFTASAEQRRRIDENVHRGYET